MGLVGRSEELAALDRALNALDSGAAALEIVGEPGIGKTRLLAELCAHADAAKALVLQGRAAELEGSVPFAVFGAALDDYLASLNPRWFEALGEQDMAELARMFPSLSDLAAESPPATGDERYRSHRAVRTLLEKLAARQPVVLALDDMHWADEASLELTAHLLRHPPRGGVLLAMALRPQPVANPLREALDVAEREGGVERLELAPLAEAEAHELLGAGLDPALEADLYRESGGNPFYLEQLARVAQPVDAAPAQGGRRAAASGRTQIPGVPRPVAAAIDRELEALVSAARLLLRGASVVGETFQPDLAAEAAGIPESDALSALDEVLDRDLVLAGEVPREFSFRHPIVRRAVYESSPPGWRLAAHARVAAALEARRAPALARAPHVEASAEQGDEKAASVLAAAAAAAAPRAPAAAAHWYAAALRVLPDGDVGRRLGLLVPQAQALGAAGRFEESRRALDEVLLALPPDQTGVRAQVVAGCARIDQILGRHGEARDLLASMLDALPDEPSSESTDLKIQLASECFFTGDFDGLRRWVGEALEDASARDDPAAQAAARGLMGCADYMVDEVAAARVHLDESALLFGQLSDEQVSHRLHTLSWCGVTEVYLERFDRALALFDRGLSVALATGHGHIPTLMRIGQALALLWRGRLDAADERLELASEAALLTGNRQFLSWALWARCWGATLAGELGEAVRIGERAVEAGRGLGDPVSAIAGCYLAEARLEAGEPGRAREELLVAAGGDELPLVERAFKSHWYEILTRADLAANRLEAAAAWADRAQSAAEGLEIAGRDAEAARARAAVMLARDESEPAAQAALEAVELARAAGLPIEAGRARTLAGRALAAAGHGARATGELERACAELEACGAARYRDAAASELRGLGQRVTRRVRPAAGEGVAALSGREREVADHVGEGMTNREIAEVLFLSPRTVEAHMRRIFSKLEVSSRAQLVRQLDREPAGGDAERIPARGAR